MNLSDVEIIPGVIVDSNDPQRMGQVRVNAPGLFAGSSEEQHWGVQNTMDKDLLTWIKPFSMNGYQSFSKPLTGQKVWVINNKRNYNEYWYVPMSEHIAVTDQIVKEKYDNGIDVITSRDNGSGSSKMYYDRKGGYVTQLNNYEFNMTPEGNISLNGEQGDIEIRGGHVYAGKNSETWEPAVLGNKLVDLFNDMANAFDLLKLNCSTSGDNSNLQGPFEELANTCRNAGIVKATNTSVN